MCWRSKTASSRDRHPVAFVEHCLADHQSVSEIMSVVEKVAGNTAVFLSARFCNTALGVVTVYVLTRFLGPADFGLYTLLFTYVAVAGNFVDFGFRSILTREMSRQREDIAVITGNVMMIRLCLAVIVIVMVNVLVYFLRQDPTSSRIMLILSMSLFFIAGDVFESTFAANLKIKTPSVLRTSQRILLLLLILLVVYSEGSLTHIVLVEVIVGLLYISLGYSIALRYLRPVFLFRGSLWKELMQVAWPVGAFHLLDQVLRKVDIIVLSSLEGDVSVGIYSLAARLTQFLEVFIAAVMVSIFPLLSRYYKAQREKFEALWRLSFKYLMAFVTLVCLVIFYIAEPLVLTISGREFSDASLALRVLIWSQVFVYARLISASILVAIDQQKLALIFTSVSVLANIGLDLLLIPRMGYLGACWASVISYGLIFPVAYFLQGSRPYIQGLFRSLLRPILALLGAVSVVLLIDGDMIVNVLLAVLVYTLVLVLTGIFAEEDIRFIKRIFSR